jgi:hypothetical protein
MHVLLRIDDGEPTACVIGDREMHGGRSARRNHGNFGH